MGAWLLWSLFALGPGETPAPSSLRSSAVEAPAADASTVPAPDTPVADRSRRRATGLAFGLLAVSGGAWAATAVLRAVPARRAREAEARCEREADEFGEQLGCGIGAGIGAAFDTAQYWGLSYATAVPAVALTAASGYFFGRATRDPLQEPKTVRQLGLGFIAAGAAVWLIPRMVFPARPDETVRAFTPTFYAGFGAAAVGAALLTYVEGAPRKRPRRHARVSLDPTGLTLSGSF